jgi:hypothetical protein
MRVHVYFRHLRPAPGRGVSEELKASAAGFKVHGIKPRLMLVGSTVPCDLAVVWGVRKRREMASGRRCMVLERGYIGDRHSWTSAGYDGLNGFADFCNDGADGEEWKRFGIEPLPWRGYDGEYVLILGQVPGDASLRNTNISRWYADTAKALREAGHKVAFRRHPGSKHAEMLKGAETLGPDVSLKAALAKAKWAVTFNSNSAVDAVMQGVPAVTCDRGAMAWDVTGHSPTEPPPMPDRAAWLSRMGLTQWSRAELISGAMWEHMKAGMEK